MQKLCDKVREIIRTNNKSDFLSLLNFLKYTNCKTETEIRGIFSNCGMPPGKFDELKRK